MNNKVIIALAVSAILTTPLLTPVAQANPQAKQAAYLELLDQQIAILDNFGSEQQVKNLQSAKNNLLFLSDDELNRLPDVEYLTSLKSSNQILLNKIQTTSLQKQSTSFNIQATTTLTPPDYPNFPLCATSPGQRHDDLVVFISEQALFVAESVREIASRGCEQVVVALGAGGNTSAACIVTDAVYIAAKEAHNIISFCDAEVDEAQLEAAFLRTEDLFNLGHELSSELLTHDSDLKNNLATHDTEVKANLMTHDTDIKSNLATHDLDIKNLLIQVLANQGEMLANQTTIIELLNTPQGKRPAWNDQ